MRKMYRYLVPIDDFPHLIPLSPMWSPVAVATGSGERPDAGNGCVEFWCEHEEGTPEIKHAFQVFGTGHELPDGAQWIGTTARDSLGLVWHLYEVRS